MVDVGSPNNLVTNNGWILKQGTDQYILKNTLDLDISRPKFRDAITIGPTNTFGAGDHSVPVQFEADIAKSVNWVNLNARDQVTGFLVNLPYTLTMNSKSFTDGGTLPIVTVTVANGKIATTTISGTGNANIKGSIILALSGGGFSRAGKLVGVVSGEKLAHVIIIDAGEGYTSAPTVAETKVVSPVIFSFNAEVGSLTLSQSDSDGRVKIDAVLTVTDDVVIPIVPT